MVVIQELLVQITGPQRFHRTRRDACLLHLRQSIFAYHTLAVEDRISGDEHNPDPNKEQDSNGQRLVRLHISGSCAEYVG